MTRTYALTDIPAAHDVLVYAHRQLHRRGLAHAVLTLADDPAEYPFDLLTGLRVIDHGMRRPDRRCQACPHHPALRFEFLVTDLTGRTHGPVGSTCLFRHVLGDDAETTGQELKTHVGAATDHPDATPEERHRHAHEARLEDEGHFRGYLKALGLGWILDELRARRRVLLGDDLYDRLDRMLGGRDVLTLREYRALLALTPPQDDPGRQAPARGPRLTLPLPPANPRPESTSSGGATSAPGTREGRPRTRTRSTARRLPRTADRPFTPGEWDQYLRDHKLRSPYDFWPWFRTLVTLPEDDLADVETRFRRRRPLRAQQHDAIQRAHDEHAPLIERLVAQHRPQAGAWRTPERPTPPRPRRDDPPAPAAPEQPHRSQGATTEERFPAAEGLPVLPDLPRFIGRLAQALHAAGRTADAAYLTAGPAAQSDFVRAHLPDLYRRLVEDDFRELTPGETDAVTRVVAERRASGLHGAHVFFLPHDQGSLRSDRVYVVRAYDRDWRVWRSVKHADRIEWDVLHGGGEPRTGELRVFHAWLTPARPA